MKRTCIYPKDIQRITGRSGSYCRKILSQIRATLGKEPHQFVTVEEFAVYSGLDLATIEPFIVD
ncbi:hypothetical protein C21_00375 [Arenibacter sp. NBRC 103722]|uniref:hypothetical protein n=1 Tax=Arenibacter sp. NBRC 103722 TaxID=1113929 RepID=UPI0008534BB2|nr:hypothetical protein [Arenibacter sp. NBRC 103722]GBF18218.1 hypothetical protein C21_00375 [Arenibacter sp. NBRC 103722]|tara:strand:- start:227 stop:418 length:192 start_codon:yes stop_codon:yes gene_type:complete